jgi:Cytochrome c7 and related cytochrome c
MRNFQAGLIKYLLLLLFLFTIIKPASPLPAVSKSGVQGRDTSRAPKKDMAVPFLKNSDKFPQTDTAKSQKPDTTRLLIKPGANDTTKAREKDSTKLQTKDTLNRQLPDSAVYQRKNFTAEELLRGERLFYGLVYLGNKSIDCAACHNTNVIDTLNWNPDALEISKKYLSKSAKDLSRVLLKPVGVKMKLVHKGFQLSAQDIVLLKAYMDKFVGIGLRQNKPLITNLLLFIIATLLFLLSSVDLIIKKIYKNQKINWAILTVTGIFIIWILAVNAIAFGRAKGFAPAQPIKFSHAVHSGQNKTDCNYCHYSARISKDAGIPTGSICYNCHLLVRTGTRSGVTEIAKVIKALDEKKPVDWVRIYKLPDFVFFSHEQHVSAGGITCDACHGDVKTMNRIYQVPDLSMGWCIECHKTRKVNFSDEYYKTYYPGYADSLRTGLIDSVRVIGVGGRDCGQCHY